MTVETRTVVVVVEVPTSFSPWKIRQIIENLPTEWKIRAVVIDGKAFGGQAFNY